MSTVRIGVVGTGWWATEHHLPSLLSDSRCRVTALCDSDPARLSRVADIFGIAAGFTDHVEMLESDLLDGVVVATSSATHHQVARAALDRGVHVMVEKPMALRAEDAWDLVARAERGRLHLVVGYTFNFTAHAAAAAGMVRDGDLGPLQLVTGLFASSVEGFLRGRPEELAEHCDWAVVGPRPETYSGPGAAGGGQANSQLTHTLGSMLQLTGERCAEVSARMSRYDLDVDLVDVLSMRLRGGALASLSSTGAVPPGLPRRHRVSYFFRGGALHQDLLEGTLEASIKGAGTRIWEPLTGAAQYPAGAPARCLVSLIAGEDADNPAPGSVGARAVEAVEAAYASDARGGAAVSIAAPAHPDPAAAPEPAAERG